MALIVRIPVIDVATQDADELSHSFRSMGGNNKMESGFVCFPFDNTGENYFSPYAYSKCNEHGWKCDGGMFYFVFTDALKDNLVPTDYPGSKDAEGERISYEDYFRKDTQYDLGDGTWLFRICRTGQILSNEDRLTYQNDLGTLLVKAEGVAKIPTVVE